MTAGSSLARENAGRGDAVDVVVVGAGFAGLVLEARERIGGRAYSGSFPEAGCSVELGGAWFDADWQTVMREEADRYGIAIAPATAYQTTRWFTGGELPLPRRL